MYANTLVTRSLLKLAFEAAGANIPEHTYTEKTSEFDKDRRSVVFEVHPKFADEVKHQAIDFFKEAGFTESIPKLTTHVTYPFFQTCYIRVIAYKD